MYRSSGLELVLNFFLSFLVTVIKDFKNIIFSRPCSHKMAFYINEVTRTKMIYYVYLNWIDQTL